MDQSGQQRAWTVDEAQAQLAEVLRLAAEEGPQQIGTDRPFVVVLAETWYAQKQAEEPSKQEARKPMGQWLVENMPHGFDLELPDRREPDRQPPFLDQEDE